MQRIPPDGVEGAETSFVPGRKRRMATVFPILAPGKTAQQIIESRKKDQLPIFQAKHRFLDRWRSRKSIEKKTAGSFMKPPAECQAEWVVSEGGEDPVRTPHGRLRTCR
jgi:hypothetical protein